MKIVIFNSSYPQLKCGIGDYTQQLARSIVSFTNHEVTVITSTFKEVDNSGNEKLKVLPIIDTWTPLDFMKKLFVLRRESPDLVIAEYPAVAPNGGGNLSVWIPILSKLFLRPKKIYFILHEFSTIPEDSKIRFKKSFIFSDKIIVFNPRDYEDVKARLRTRKNRVKVSFIGVNFQNIKQDKYILDKLRSSLHIDLSTKIIGFFGFINNHKEKGFEVLLKAFSSLREERKDIVLLVVGGTQSDNSYINELYRLIKKLNIKDSVILTGYLDRNEALNYINLFYCSVLPYLNGAKQNRSSLLVCLSQGIPVITTKVEGFTPEIFVNDENIILTDPGSVYKLKKEIEKLLNNDEKRELLSKASLKLAEKFNWKLAVMSLLEGSD